MAEKLYLPVIAGTKRAQRLSINPAKLVAAIGQTFAEVNTELLDPNDFNFPGDGKDPESKDPRYTDITRRADGFFIVTPEYNHSFPGSLKRMLDSEIENYLHKPVAFAGVSNGSWGGVRAIESLVNAVRGMGLIASKRDVQFPRVQDTFDETGKLLDLAYEERIRRAWRELIWLAQTLKAGRSNAPE